MTIAKKLEMLTATLLVACGLIVLSQLFPPRFSIRSLLIATTLIAVLLGLVAIMQQ